MVLAVLVLAAGCEAPEGSSDSATAARPAASGSATAPSAPGPREILDRHQVGGVWTATADFEVLPTDPARKAWQAAYAELLDAGALAGREGPWLRFSAAGEGVRIRPPATGWLALVVDDVGFRSDRIRAMLAWQQPVVFAILPRRPLSASLADEIHAAGGDVFLHQPMEPAGYPVDNPGEHALLIDTGPEQWSRTLDDNLASLPHTVGLNNHMGSRFTATATAMTHVAGWLKERQLLFLDSLTTGGSQAGAACRAAGVPYLERDVFLDHERSPEFLHRQIAAWMAVAERQGLAIAIAHPYQVTVDALTAALPRMRAAGFRWVGYPHLKAIAEARGKGA